MATSIEILVIGAKTLPRIGDRVSFAILNSYPPRSHRGPSSLWQREFDKQGGTLVHVGDPDILQRDGLFWAYNILEDIDLRRYRFRSRYKTGFFNLLQLLLEQSQDGAIVLTSDSQFGPRPLKYHRKYSIKSVKRMHEEFGLRLNSSMRIEA